MSFKKQIKQGIPNELPEMPVYDSSINRAPKRKDILTSEEKKLALKNALRYFDAKHHAVLLPEFAKELEDYGRIYMYRFRPTYKMKARDIKEYPGKCSQAKAIMLMIQNNLDYAVAQHPHELITYGGNGGVFSNWAQYLLTMKYLSEMTDTQTLTMYSGHPMGLFPSHKDAPRVVVTNGMMIPNYSKPDDLEKFNALGVTQYGQMTAGSYMYIGPQGIVHGTTITVLNAFRKIKKSPKGNVFLTAGLGGMSGAQPKAGSIAGCITVCAEVNPKITEIRLSQGWIDEKITDLDELVTRVKSAKENQETVSIAYLGNIVDVWEKFDTANVHVDLGSDQTSLHNPWAGGYYPADISFDDANEMMANEPELFKEKVQETLRRHAKAINKHTEKGTYFFDYGNAFLLEASRAGATVHKDENDAFCTVDNSKLGSEVFAYSSYVQDIMGPMCFDYGFGPFRWVCASGNPEDLAKTDAIACKVLEKIRKNSPVEIQQQMADNIQWIKGAQENKLVVGSQARILYADAEGRAKIAEAFNKAIKKGKIGKVVLGRDHHDVSGTDSPYRETSNIYDGSRYTADMAIQNVIGDSFRGATWVSIHNGGGVGWGEVINGGFGMLLDGSKAASKRLKSMLFWDVNNGIARRSWARNHGAVFAIKRAMKSEKELQVTVPNFVDDALFNTDFKQE
ncbi:urocanate hydratase [Tenacibaculum finnmarkense genomovar finnmarkense]|uniref:urocanate hydratase n=2 Tax=Tenacibaculum finnmarkense TaxID=2781243 RepID=UPI001E44B966|nr:urocanate hydratase [Tenacibaculum finnmarkense]MCD8401968.1 urocanate hydratase [Tenacibaculum finnmarkense genomovar finnmarkense]MCD8445959.1 urocanate hydratase [Tenacibaculum finnmarkense genomovar finnmarkense]MCD8452988.1 urocanate hydratase [Tenacibaculum finnmarkense genomovar ulcerans]MCG8211602.1 urocanate hydratase [Tenacibaculum finnmarkense genomovar finnmarkense]MCG8218928.1 urocanate hydratase [Tenacibaculum finnmarkense genomovar finnmarkense]